MIKRFNKDTKTYQLFKALQAGEHITPAQAARRFGIKNIRAEVSRIRARGFAVYSKSYVAGNNVKVTYYVIGTPSQELVALGYKAMALGITL
jgi:hypothetical protein